MSSGEHDQHLVNDASHLRVPIIIDLVQRLDEKGWLIPGSSSGTCMRCGWDGKFQSFLNLPWIPEAGRQLLWLPPSDTSCASCQFISSAIKYIALRDNKKLEQIEFLRCRGGIITFLSGDSTSNRRHDMVAFTPAADPPPPPELYSYRQIP
ncbi:hypothetical protein J7T55_010922 [Diaporthe amygdali]|uniref:uncharacterized protein n=1 Tax=Phomopsis amygdali TaxID=1214568 RepID=UPI0022FEDE6D|nr:uncharacterized protein J7T55_010922 [Diaporthe amygdali]KAJ0104456.1 hypothetical protein J7T55_010922 [Diaporthe amygdali]